MRLRLFVATAAAVLLTGCSEGFSGSYQDEMGVSTYSFNSNGKVVVSAMGTEKTFEFKRDDKTLRLQDGNQSMVLTIVDEDTLKGMNGMLTMKKVKG